jgi:inorganic triphosphatase YgiF
MEIEAKFQVADEETYLALQAIQMIGEFTLAEATTKDIMDDYLDTTDRRLLTAGYACRRRWQEGKWIMALKGLGGVSGAVHRREELELELASIQPPHAWPSSPIRERVLSLIDTRSLQSIFNLKQTRQVREVYQAAQLIALWSLDAVQLGQADQTDIYFELEIELTPSGSETHLTQMAQHLQAEWGLQPESRSKFERGLAVIDGRL